MSKGEKKPPRKEPDPKPPENNPGPVHNPFPPLDKLIRMPTDPFDKILRRHDVD